MLRKLTVDDVDDLLMITGNPDVVRFIPGMIQDKDILVSWSRSLPSTDHKFMVLKSTASLQNERIVTGKSDDGCADNTHAAGEVVIGECSLDNSGEIGLMLLPEYWRKGYGTATVQQLMKIAFDLGLSEVSAQSVAENKACIGLFRSLGFTVNGMGWFVSEGAIYSPESGMEMSQGMIVLHRNLQDKKTVSEG